MMARHMKTEAWTRHSGTTTPAPEHGVAIAAMQHELSVPVVQKLVIDTISVVATAGNCCGGLKSA